MPKQKPTRHRTDELYSETQTIRRSRIFFVTPLVVIAALAANLVWEAIRENVGIALLREWPFRFTFLDVPTTATILAIFAGLFMGRLQWVQTLRPHVGSAFDDEGAAFRIESERWRFWVYNAGPGAAIIDDIKYYVRFSDQPDVSQRPDWVSVHVLNDQFRSRNLRDGIDYHIRWHASASPFPATSHYTEGRDMAWFSVRALAQLEILDVRVRFSDTLGDSYEKLIPMMHRLPSVTVAAIANQRSRNGPMTS